MKEKIFLLPGWATDSRVFSINNNIKRENFFLIDYTLRNFEEQIIQNIKESDEKIIIIGWSMGAFLGYDFSLAHPELVSKLVLVSSRKQYKKDELKLIKEYIKKGKEGFLYKFYLSFFTKNEQEQLRLFRDKLLKEYIKKFDEKTLLEGLDYLFNAKLEIEKLEKTNEVIFIHGEDDKVAPLDEVKEMHNKLCNSKLFVIKESGHAPFVSLNFNWEDYL